jgi:hypothetical protein
MQSDKQKGAIMNQPKEITLCNLEVIIMPNGEVICLGERVGWFSKLRERLTPKALLEVINKESEESGED